MESLQASGAAVSWGAVLNSAAGGRYRLCWCTAWADCSDPQLFGVDVGELQLYGPTPLEQDRTCISGRTCSFGGQVHGAHSWSVSILDTCGLNPDLPSGTAAVIAAGSLTSVSFDVLTAAGGVYRLCWCASRACSTVESFSVDAGKLELVGTSPTQDRTCISGRTCEIDGISGHHISSNDFVQILETCGQTASELSLPKKQLSFEGGSARATWPSVPLAAYGGQYKICWCSADGASFGANSSHDCSSSKDFNVKVGNLMILGPGFLEQTRTCISGLSCRLTGLVGEGLLAGSSEILVAETCGSPSVVSGFPRARDARQQNLLLEASWPAVTAAGGQYRLCWCTPTNIMATNTSNKTGARECEVASNYRVDVGVLTVLGPLLNQDRTCISGLTCFVDGILGEGLREADSVLVLGTCGVEQVVPRFSGSGFFTNISRSGASVSWGGTPNTAAGGDYRLCWCSADSACSMPADFQVDFGSLALLGVSSLFQSATCVAGRACPSSWTFGSVQEAIALDTCGVQAALAPVRVQSNITGLEILEQGAAGNWRLCWCPSQVANNSSATNWSRCETMLDYLVDVGEVKILGPLPTHGHTCVAGLPCLADGLLGLGLFANDSFMVLATCGTISAPSRFPNSGRATFDSETGTLNWDGNSSLTAVTAAGGQYRLCWCHPLSAADCLASADFRYDVGSLAVLGPAPLQQDQTCISGAACTLRSLTGNFLSAGDALMLMQSCGSRHGILPGFPATELGNSTLIVSASGGSYRICWCTPPTRAFAAGLPSFPLRAREGCDMAEDFAVDMGAFTLLGPLHNQERTCVAGAICSSALQGFGMTLDYRLQILDTCSGSAAEVANIEASNGSVPLWFDNIAAAGGAYRLCWCGLHTCDEMIDVGTVFLLGVGPLQQDRTCVAGQTCKLEGVLSYGDLDSSHLMILQTCNVPQGIGVADVRAVTESGVAHGNFSNASGEMLAARSKAWLLDKMTLPGGGYRMCWCGSMGVANSTENVTTDWTVSGAQVDFGQLLVIGPSSIAESTCVSGQPCFVDGLVGESLSSSDFVTILETCGQTPIDMPQGFPQHGLAVRVAASGTAANWGFLTPITSPGGYYRLCWCAAGFSCSSPEDFSVEAGSLSLRGPGPLSQDRTCLAGYSCHIGLDGLDLGPYVVEAVTGFRLALLPANAMSAGLTALDVYYTSQSLNASEAKQAASCSTTNTGSFAPAGQALLWFSCTWQPAVTASTWLISLDSDATLQMYEAEFLGRSGWTTIVGASGILADSTRLSDGVFSSWVLPSSGPVQLGFQALQPDMLLLADTCAVDPLSSNSLAWGPVSLRPQQIDILTVQGGRYRLCWCARGFRCSFMEDFSVDAGQLTVIGPKTSYNTCIAGQSCSIELDGHYLSDANQVLVLHTCAVENAGVWKLTDLGAWQHLSSSGVLLSARGTITAAAGTYKLCWCSGFSDCTTASDFSVEAGNLWVMGVAPLAQAHTCVSGQTCVVDHLSGLGLSKDQVMILETCGTSSLLYRGLDASEATNGSSAILTWQHDLTAAGGQYRLCWCSAADGCSMAADFRVDFGQFTIVGPSPLQQSWTCISGLSCRIDGITGFGTDMSTEIVVMDTCGASDSQILFYDSPTTSIATSWENTRLSLPGASYRICWCAASNYPCSVTDNYKTDFGSLLVIGPYPLMQDRTCVAGQICEVDGFTGVGLSSSDLLVIQDTCANYGSRIGLPAAGSLLPVTAAAGSAYMSAESGTNSTIAFNTVSAMGGQYRLCWTSWLALQLETQHFDNSSNDTSFEETREFLGGCNDTLGGNRTCALAQAPGRRVLPVNAMIDLGRLTLIGPSPLDQSRTCVSGQLCSFGGLAGKNLDVSDQIAVLDTCGQPIRASLSLSRSFASWVDFGITTLPGGTYRLCWCSQPADCGLAESFLVDFGSLSVIGPEQSEQFTCVSGRLCTVSGLLGRSFSADDRLAILDTCGVTSAGGLPPIQGGASTLVPRIPGDGLGMSTASAAKILWDGKLTAYGGLYRLCWCAGSPTGAFDNPADPLSGSMWTGGGMPANLSGNQSSSRRLSSYSGLHEPNLSNDTNFTDPGFLCQQVSQFRVDVGQLMLIGPSRLHGATCVSGQTCVIDVVTRPFDSFMLMDTCAISASSLGGQAARSESLVSWGSSALVGAGGTYRLCWCWNDAGLGNISNATNTSAPGSSLQLGFNSSNASSGSREACQYTHDFAADAGPVFLLGPSPLRQDRTCVSGHTCTIEGIVGAELEDLLIQDTCGSPMPVISLANFSSVDHRWELQFLTQQGGTYRLCWCSSMFSCQKLQDFRVDFGILHLLGPSPLSQDRTCISGCPCTIDRLDMYPPDLTGMSLLVLRSCASMHLVDGFPTDAARIDTSTRAATWSDVTAAGGSYRLCWHAEPDLGSWNLTDNSSVLPPSENRSFQSWPPHHSVFIGQLLLIGPARDHEVTCISGSRCSAKLRGLHLSDSDFMSILDTCGVSASSQLAAVQPLQFRGSQAVFVDWPGTSMNFDGGQYRMCWCSGNNASRCDSAQFFQVDAGSLFIRGPRPVVRTCLVGRPCPVTDLDGFSLSPSDHLLLLETCGSLLVAEGSDSQSLSTKMSATFTVARAGAYRLCWCGTQPWNPNATACSSPFEFGVDAGYVSVLGPLPSQQRTCVSGRRCALDGLVGHGLGDDDVVLVMDTCGSPNVIPLFTRAGLSFEVGRSGASVSWGDTLVTSMGGSYRLCWCTRRGFNASSAANSTDPECSLPEAFGVDFGTLLLRGPAELPQPLRCTAGDECVMPPISGLYMSSMDSLRVLDTCGVDVQQPVLQAGLSLHVFAVTYPFSNASSQSNTSAGLNLSTVQTENSTSLQPLPPAGIPAAGGEYRLCWCGHESNCLAASSHRVDFGSLALSGPLLMQSRTCTSGQSCVIDSILGYSLSNSTSFLVMDTCGMPLALQGAFSNPAVSSSGAAVRWATEPVQGGLYRLCWCGAGQTSSNVTQGRCELSSSFDVDFGSLIVRGPSPMHQAFTCVGGQQCVFVGISGQDLSSADQYLVLDTCSSSKLAIGEQEVRIMFSRQPYNSSLESDTVVMVPGGQYRLCWCGSSGLENSSRSSCSLPNEYLVDFASLTVIGPSHFDQDKTCIAGMRCAVPGIEGHLTSGDDMLLVAATCGLNDALVHGLTDSGLLRGSPPNATSSRWLMASASAQGGQYRLCWCAAGQVCSTMEHFRVDVGTFNILGPVPTQQAFTCLAGQQCVLDSIAGWHMNSHKLAILETCGLQTGVGRLPNAGFSTSVANRASWGPLAVTAAGGQYRLCWCADLAVDLGNRSQNASGGCFGLSDFALDLGSLTILGPAPLSQHRTCISGRRCELDGITGQGLTNDDTLLVLETCGEPSAVVPGWGLGGASVETQNSGAAASWQAVVTAAGGQYRLCWCATPPRNATTASQQFCDRAGAFVVDIGSMLLVGPRPLAQDRTCISGQTCASSGLTAAAAEVSLPGRVHVLDTCGLKGSLAGFPTGGRSDGEVSLLEGFAPSSWFAGEVLNLDGASIISWTSEALTVSSGQYRLCWCTLIPGPTNNSACSLASQFALDFGTLHVYGPASGHRRTCVSGYMCALDGIAGYGLSQNDSILVLETCGSDQIVPNFPSGGQIETASSSGSRISWGDVVLSAYGGTYRLCWCSQGESCNRPHAFPFDLGELVVLGPVRLDQTCVAGQTCRLDGLQDTWSEENSYMILETCGVAASPLSVLTAGAVLSGAPGQASWGPSPLRSGDLPAGIYQLCWCSPLPSLNSTSPSNRTEQGNLSHSCQLSVHHRVTIGTLTMIGASVEQRRTCVSGLTCVIDSIEGYQLSREDTVLVMETCGIEVSTGFSWAAQASNVSANRLSFSWGSARVTPSGGSYRLCWCGASMVCSLASHFRVDFGQLSMLGPAPLAQHQTCVSGHLCQFPSGLMQSNATGGIDLRYATIALDTCGGVAVPPGFPVLHSSNHSWNATVPNQGLLSASSHIVMTAPGGIYRLCWCGIPETAMGCQLPADFLVDLGSLSLIGPRPTSHSCISGRLCVLADLQGLHLSNSNVYMALDTCGTAVPGWPEGYAGLVSPPAFIPEKAALLGGHYQLCWCAGVQEVPPNASQHANTSSACRRAEDFSSPSGTFTIFGPSPLNQHRTCVSGQTCVLDGLTGLGLSAFDMLAVQDTCGIASSPPGFPAAAWLQLLPGFSARAAWNLGISSAGGEYRLCWTRVDASNFSNSSTSAESAVFFNVDFGRLLLVGPSPLQQTATCVSGQSCALDVFAGYGLDAGGHLALADTCGVLPADKRRFPSDGLLSWGANQSIVTWSSAVITAAGQSYRLCWCAEGFACNSLENFQVDAGVLYLIGPAPLSQGRTCISGSSCRFALDLESVSYNSSGQSQILIMSTCGAFAGDLMLPAQFSGSVGSPSWSSVILPGGAYRLCWCAVLASGDCAISEHFTVDLGSFLLLGPRPGQEFTCWSGQPCHLHSITVVGGAESDSMLIAETCGAARSRRRQSLTVVPRILKTAPDVLSASWGEAALVQAAGDYQLCWCGRSCRDAKDFSSSAGTLRLRGPSPLDQQFTCVAGQACSLQGLSGPGISAGVLLVTETCGSTMTTLQLALGEPDGFTSGDVYLSGGSYRLCWCAVMGHANASECELPSSFLVDAGMLRILGPSPLRQLYTCVSGQTCAVHGIQGSLRQGDAVALLDTCGSVDAWPLNLFDPQNLQADGGWALSWGQAALLTPGGEYRLCWCAEGSLCQDGSAFRLDFGSLTLLGPEKLLLDRTCVSGRTCSFDGLISSSGVLILDTCGWPSVGKQWNAAPIRMPHFMSQLEHMEIQNGRVHWGDLQFSAAGGSFRLCWCAANATCLVPEHFQLDIGQLLLIGPSFGHSQTCISSHTCSITGVKGWQLSEADRIMVLDTCAQAGNNSQVPAAILGFPFDGVSWSTVQELNSTETGSSSGALMRFELHGHISARGGMYRLCWCGANAACSSSEDFLVDFGELHLLGPSPLQQSHTCISGHPCLLDNLAGHHVGNGQIAVFDTCGARGVGLDGTDPRASSVADCLLHTCLVALQYLRSAHFPVACLGHS